MKTLQNSDVGLLPVLAQFWSVSTENLETAEVISSLIEVMLDAGRVEQVWEGLADDQRGALQMLISSGGQMPTAKFERLFGEIRKMGAGRIEREKPLENPASVAEALFYRGLIAETFEQTGTGMRGVIYVPVDLAEALPLHKTSYDDLEESDEAFAFDADYHIEPLENVENVEQADTSIVDDLTTLLAYLQVHNVEVVGDSFSETDVEALFPHLLKPGAGRLAFLLGLGLSAGLLDVDEGRAYPRRAEARRWLSEGRAPQVEGLTECWRDCTDYRDLWHVPGLHPEPTGWAYDPVAARHAVLGFIHDIVPPNDWWSIDDLIMTIKEVEPDFQRPGSDYESWYIRNDAGDYLRGYESWDAVEGALLEFYLLGPMHWLGLVDLAADAARLTAYGRAFLSSAHWPSRPEQAEKITLFPDATLRASRRVSRIDRFQLARFSNWVTAATLDGGPYIYKLDAGGIQRGAEQGITTEHIASFLKRMTGDKALPPAITRLLEAWQEGSTSSVTLERLLVLRTTAPETLDFILDTPALRRYLGARLGPMACVVRADGWEALRDALGERGIEVEVVA